MRKKIFVDTNILISGIFFEGNESRLLASPDIALCTCDIVVEELKTVVHRKLKSLKIEDLRIALLEIDYALSDFEKILTEEEYKPKLTEARKFIKKGKDSKILAAVLTVKPDYFVTGDEDFFSTEIKAKVPVYHTRELSKELGINI